MTTPRLVVVHNNVDTFSSIGAISAWDVREALKRNWNVTVVSRDVAEDLRPWVDHRPLYVPPRIHSLQWSVARATVKRALRGVHADVTVVHQPQVAALADIWNVHYLSRAAREASPEPASGVLAHVRDLQSEAVAAMEDQYLRRLPRRTRVWFCGDGLRSAFTRLYGEVKNSKTIYNPAFGSGRTASTPLPDRERRARLVGEHRGPVVGFLGGGDVRKGADVVTASIAADPSLFLVYAGPTAIDDSDHRLHGRVCALGNLSDVNDLLDVVDVLLVPSRFDPFPLVVAEAATRGVPLLVARTVGSATLVVERRAGELWPDSEALGPVVARLIADRLSYERGGRRLAEDLDPDKLAVERFAEIDAVLARKRCT